MPCLKTSKPTNLAWYEELMRVNLWGSVCCTHAALPYLKQSHGRIVAVSSLAGTGGCAWTHRLQRQ
jgi:NAD(P)-dependent dehydrogenase (short-subunit alcohol dehydrogenase family)